MVYACCADSDAEDENVMVTATVMGVAVLMNTAVVSNYVMLALCQVQAVHSVTT